MNLFQTELGFIQTILLILLLIFAAWGFVYATSILVGIVWVVLVVIVAVIIYLLLHRIGYRLIHGGGGRK